MQRMYNTDALQTFIGAVEGVRADQRAADENQMRMMALESQLATEQAERDLLPMRLELESKKLNYEMQMGKVDMLLKVAGSVDQLQTNQLSREVTTFELGEKQWASPYNRALMQLQYQDATLDSWYKPYYNAAKLEQMVQMNITGPLHAMAAWMTAQAPTLAYHANSIKNADDIILQRTSAFVDGLVDKNEDGSVKGWKGRNKWIGGVAAGAVGAALPEDPNDAMASWGTRLADDWGESFKVVDENGNVSYKLPDRAQSEATLRGANINLVTKGIIQAALDSKSNLSAGPMEARGTYISARDAARKAIEVAASSTPVGGDQSAPMVVNNEKVKEIQSKIDRYLYDTSEFGQNQLREYLFKTGGHNLVLAVMGKEGTSEVNLRMAGFNMASFAEPDDKSLKFTSSKGGPLHGVDVASYMADQIIPPIQLNKDTFSGILEARTTRDNTIAAVRGLEGGMIGGLSFGDHLFRNSLNAMTSGLFGGSFGKTAPPGGGKWDATSMNAHVGNIVNVNIENWMKGIESANTTAYGGYDPSANLGEEPPFDPAATFKLPQLYQPIGQ